MYQSAFLQPEYALFGETFISNTHVYMYQVTISNAFLTVSHGEIQGEIPTILMGWVGANNICDQIFFQAKCVT